MTEFVRSRANLRWIRCRNLIDAALRFAGVPYYRSCDTSDKIMEFLRVPIK